MKKNHSYIKADDSKIIKESSIIWVKKISDCLEVCTKTTGCSGGGTDTHKICKLNNPESYHKLNKQFE